ncbi:hypothetical protein EAI_11276 [Harpegnathos saltator]|uniref:Uncharacterized protein n=1 Tax=Harpegnathos saltator TaxID=610380 RepID=E2BDM6_HARSA|nr:hypothetical protein EAI_11276 [Harpegnathos saltator]
MFLRHKGPIPLGNEYVGGGSLLLPTLDDFIIRRSYANVVQKNAKFKDKDKVKARISSHDVRLEVANDSPIHRVLENKPHPREDSLLATKKARNLITSGPISKAKNRVSAIKIHKDLLSGENEFFRLSSPKRADTSGTGDPVPSIAGSIVVKCLQESLH